MSEKKIQRGYYRLESRLSGSKSDIVRVHGMTQEGLVICETAEGHVYRIPDKRNGWYHLLQCTGFNWVEPKPEVWPKYYRGKLWADYDAFLEIHNASERGIVVRPSGKRELAPVDWDYDAALECVLQGSWIELTEAEALARIATKQPEEMVRVKLQKWVEPNGRGDFKFLRTDNEHGAGGYTRVNEWMEIEVPISKL